MFRSTFAVGHPRQDRNCRLLAAALACGRGTVVSHGTAAALLDLWEFWPAEIEVIAPVEAGRKIRGIRRRFVPPPPWDEETEPGARALAAVLAPRSRAESDGGEDAAAPDPHHLPIPECNVKLRIEGEVFEVDFLWRDEKVVVETDGGRFHDNPVAQARDGHRNRALARAGYRVPRIGWEELRDEPDRAITEIRRFLISPICSAYIYQ